ncbi:hypothetical protein BC332_19239 [Capsicum chinense]|nr:hypothetical protein BC332_19239 [Capsicum chinense]
MANEICIRIRIALNKNSKVLGLSFSRRDTFQPHAYYGLPNCILSRSNLVELWLTYECAMITKVDNSTPNDDRGQKSEAMFLNILSWIHQYEFDEDEYWNKVEAPVRCLIHHLKTVEVAGLVIEKLVDSVSGIFAWAFHGVKEKEDIPKKEIHCPSSLVSDKACE